ncbi:DUF72 domain-containing protein [Candidatus Latescibacterota bacterium]
MISIGTSGFSFNDWKNVFYPEGTKPGDYLSYYKDYFNTVEINSTYYGIPRAGVFENMLNNTPERFEFIVKVNKATTHEYSDSAVADEFNDSIRPLKKSGRLSGLLAQFPWGFKNDTKNRKYLSELSSRHTKSDIPFFVEFRHDSWNREEVYDYLKRLGLLFVSVDEPQIGGMMPPDVRATGDIGYVRFHGRNEKTWWGKSGDRYDYNYSEEELEEWIEKIAELEKTVWKVYAFFNNCHKGYAVRNALMFKEMLKKKGKKI